MTTTEIITYPVPTPDERMGLPSASGLEAMSLCHGRWQACIGIEQVETDDGRFGNNVHDALAAFHRFRMSGGDQPDTKNLSPDEYTAFEDCLRLEAELREATGFGLAKVVAVEERLVYNTLTGKPLFTGKNDVTWMTPGKLLVVDFKSGWVGATDAADNIQLRALALLAWKFFGYPEITVAIISPNAPRKITVAQYRADTLVASERQIVDIINRATAPGARRCPGEKQCRYCPAKPVCKEYEQWAVLPAQQELTKATQPGKALKKADVVKSVSLLTPERLAGVYSLRKPIEWLMDEVEARLKTLDSEQLASVGMEIKPGGSTSEVTDIATVFTRANEKYGFTAQEFLACCKLTKSALSEAITAKQPDLKGKALDEALDALFAGCTTDKPKAGSLAYLTTQKK